jgi:hypothetical protein
LRQQGRGFFPDYRKGRGKRGEERKGKKGRKEKIR